MVLLADDAMTGEISRFIEATADAVQRFISKEVERWLHRSLCYHAPETFTGSLPLTQAEIDFIADRCLIQWRPVNEWSNCTLLVDGKEVAMLRYFLHQPSITVQYNCKGMIA